MGTPDPTESDLVRDASQGGASAVEALLALHLPGLEGYVRRHAGGLPRDKESAADVVQSVCREVLERLRDERLEYRGEAEFRGWLYEAALLKIKSRRRYWAAERRDPKRERRGARGSASGSGGGAALDELLPHQATTPSADAASAEEAERVRRRLDELPERYRRVIELAHLEDLSHREIAERLEITEGASRMLLSRALARLSSLVVEDGRS